MRPSPTPVGKYREYQPVVSSQSLIRVNKHAYSLPSRLIRRTLRVEQYEAEAGVFGAGVFTHAARGWAAIEVRWWTFAT